MNNSRKFTIEFFESIDEVVHNQTAKEARDKANEIAARSWGHHYTIPSEEEFAGIIKPKEEE